MGVETKKNYATGLRLRVSKKGTVETFKATCVRQRKVVEIIEDILDHVYEGLESEEDIVEKANFVHLFSIFEKIKFWWRKQEQFTGIMILTNYYILI